MKKLVGNSLDMLNIASKLYKYFQIVSFYLNFVYFVFTSTAKVKISVHFWTNYFIMKKDSEKWFFYYIIIKWIHQFKIFSWANGVEIIEKNWKYWKKASKKCVFL